MNKRQALGVSWKSAALLKLGSDEGLVRLPITPQLQPSNMETDNGTTAAGDTPGAWWLAGLQLAWRRLNARAAGRWLVGVWRACSWGG
jgi:hypothetical protein